MTSAVGTDGLAQRWGRLGLPPRIPGLDVARAIAVIGMIGAHVGIVGDPTTEDVVWSDFSTWDGLVNGRSSILFALLAGISVALLTGGPTPPTGQELSRSRLLLVGRGLAVLGIGLVLELLGTNVVVILTFYGVLFVLAPVFLTWRAKTLLLTAGLLAVVGTPVYLLIRALTLDSGGPGAQLLLTYYPLPVWLVFLLAGLGLGRLDLRRTVVARATALIGAGLAVIGYTVGSIVQQSGLAEWAAAAGTGSDPRTYAERLAELAPLPRTLAETLDVTPHSGGIPEIVGSGGLAMLIVGVCVLLTPHLRLPLVPLIALGSMPLTAYSVQIVIICIARGGPAGTPATGNDFWWSMVFWLVVGCTFWALAFGRGPLERLVGAAGLRLAGPRPAPVPPGQDRSVDERGPVPPG